MTILGLKWTLFETAPVPTERMFKSSCCELLAASRPTRCSGNWVYATLISFFKRSWIFRKGWYSFKQYIKFFKNGADGVRAALRGAETIPVRVLPSWMSVRCSVPGKCFDSVSVSSEVIVCSGTGAGKMCKVKLNANSKQVGAERLDEVMREKSLPWIFQNHDSPPFCSLGSIHLFKHALGDVEKAKSLEAS